MVGNFRTNFRNEDYDDGRCVLRFTRMLLGTVLWRNMLERWYSGRWYDNRKCPYELLSINTVADIAQHQDRRPSYYPSKHL